MFTDIGSVGYLVIKIILPDDQPNEDRKEFVANDFLQPLNDGYVLHGIQNSKIFFTAVHKETNMPDIKLNQFQYECDTWKRLLTFMMEENIYQKNRIAEILKNSFNKDLLEDVELFQSKFIKEDDLISLLRNDMAELDTLLTYKRNDNSLKEIDNRLRLLRDNIHIAEKQFSKLKIEFNSYLSDKI